MYKSVLMVCVGNICRSPMAEYLFREMIKRRQANCYVSSAGLGALVGHPADDNAIEVMHEKGINLKRHRARQLSLRLVTDNDLILTMESWQVRDIESQYPFSRGRVHILGKWNEMEIEDPYKKSKEHFEDAFVKIQKGCQQWLGRL